MCDKKVCNVCEAPFTPVRGCVIEKRCLPCQYLGLRKINVLDAHISLPIEVRNYLAKLDTYTNIDIMNYTDADLEYISNDLSISRERCRELVKLKNNIDYIAIHDLNKTYLVNNKDTFTNQYHYGTGGLDHVLKEELSLVIDNTLAKLSDREIAIIKMLYGVGYTDNTTHYSYYYDFKEVGAAFGISAAKVNKTESDALKKLRHHKVNKDLYNYFNIK